MTWLYVPLASAQASAGSTLASESLDPTRAASLSWRGKQVQPQAWSRAWKRGGFIRLLSGLTCEPSTLARGAAQWIASCRATPAKEIVSPVSGSAPTTTDGCSTGRSRSLTKAGLTPSSARTYRGTSQARSPAPFQHWSDWAAALRLEYSARLRPGPVIVENDSSCSPSAWETPSVAVTEGSRLTRGGSRSTELLLSGQAQATSRLWTTPCADDTGTRTKRYGQGGTALSMQADQHWSTPKASDGEKGGPNMRGSKGDQPLPAQAAHWPTPLTADDGRKVTARSAQTQLCNIAEAWPDQHSRPAHPTQAGGRSSPERRRLNPLFVEWLMGWPEGLSGFDTAETASCHSPQPSHGCGCMNCWLTTQRAMLSDLLMIEPPAQGGLFE